MRKIVTGILVVLLALALAVPASAHDGWSQTNTPIIAAGEVSYVEIMLGNHSNGHASYRIAGQFNPTSSKVYVVSPEGKKTDISSTRFYAGEPATETEPALNNYYVASFSASRPGAYIVSVEGDSIFKHGDVASRTLRSAKSFVAVSDIALAQRVQYLQGFGKQVATDRAEWVPLFNPAAVSPKEQVAVQLYLKGKPLAGTEVALIRRSNSAAEHLVTDENGIVRFTTGSADYYLLRAKPSTDEKKEGEYGSTNYEATMTFTVQNRSQLIDKTGEAKQLPELFLDGVRVEPAVARLQNGVLQVKAEWYRGSIGDAKGAAEWIPLRTNAEAEGFAVEYLAPVGSISAAVYLYSAN